MRKLTMVLVCAASVVASGAFAASVKSTVRHNKGVTEEGRAYTTYIAKCSNKETAPFTYWKADKTYCLGEMGTEICKKKKIAVAQLACK